MIGFSKIFLHCRTIWCFVNSSHVIHTSPVPVTEPPNQIIMKMFIDWYGLWLTQIFFLVAGGHSHSSLLRSKKTVSIKWLSECRGKQTSRISVTIAQNNTKHKTKQGAYNMKTSVLQRFFIICLTPYQIKPPKSRFTCLQFNKAAYGVFRKYGYPHISHRWINILSFLWDIIYRKCSHFKGGSTRPTWNFNHGWIIAFIYLYVDIIIFIWM